MKDDHDEPEECMCCGWPADDIESYEEPRGREAGLTRLCGVCASTHLPGFVRDRRPEDYQTTAIMLHVAICTNMILSEIRKAKEKA